MENSQYIKKLFSKYLDNSISKEELIILSRHFGKEEDDGNLQQLILAALSIDDQVIDNERLGRSVDAVAYRLREQLQPRKSTQVQRYLPYAAAILLFLIIAIAYYVFSKNENRNERQVVTAVADVKPGHLSATLTLSSGKKIILDDASEGNIITEAGVSILKTKTGELIYKIPQANTSATNHINTLSTVNGETYQILLSDGSRVWLNAATTLQFATDIKNQGKRKVNLLAGEAYFEVAKDKAHPFIVKTPTQEVEVLGTHFNINSYADEGKTTTTLAEGSVKVSLLKRAKRGSSTILKPGQQSLNSNGNINVRQADLETALAWKEGEIYFKDATIQEVLRQVSRWYNVEIQYEGTPTKEVFNGGIKRTANLSTVLHILELSNVHFKLLKKNNITSLIVQ